MNPKQYATLYTVIEKWVGSADTDDTSAFVSESVIDNMTKAAASVWDTMIESSEYTLREHVD